MSVCLLCPSLTPVIGFIPLRTDSLQRWPSGRSGSWCRWCQPSAEETRTTGSIKRGESFLQNQKSVFLLKIVWCVPPLSCASPAHGGGPSPSAGRECSVQPRRAGAGPVAVQVGPVGSEWEGWKLEVSEQAVTVAPGDGGRLLVLGARARWCPRRRGYWKKNVNKFSVWLQQVREL